MRFTTTLSMHSTRLLAHHTPRNHLTDPPRLVAARKEYCLRQLDHQRHTAAADRARLTQGIDSDECTSSALPSLPAAQQRPTDHRRRSQLRPAPPREFRSTNVERSRRSDGPTQGLGPAGPLQVAQRRRPQPPWGACPDR